MKQYRRYQMNFAGEWLRRSAMCMGLSVFLLAVYYLGFHNLKDFSFGTLLVGFWLPLILGVVFVVLLRGLKWNAPGIYALLCVAFCLVYILGTFLTGSVLRILIGIPVFALCAAVYIVIVGGYFPSWMPASLYFAGVIVVRLLVFDSGLSGITDWIKEAAVLCSMGAFLLLPMGLKEVKRK